MSTMYDLTVTSMKIGIACPIFNNSFRFWDDPGTWADPTAWSVTSVTPARVWDGYDDDRARCRFSVTTAPDDTSRFFQSTATRFWNDNDNDLSTGQDFRIIYPSAYSVGTGGINKKIVLRFDVGTSATMSVKNTFEFQTWATGADATLTLRIATAQPVVSAGYDFLRILGYFRDISATTTVDLDVLGAMFNPFDDTEALTLTNVFPANGPNFSPQNFIQEIKTPLGTTRRHDVSGGNQKYSLSFEFRNENKTTFQNLRRFWDYNSGMPGIPGLPIGLEPNIPGLPPYLMVNFVGTDFPLRRATTAAERYSGVIKMETIY